MKTTLVLLASVMLVLGTIGIAFAAQQSVTASVSVTGIASITVSSATLNFESMDEGEADKVPTVNPLVITIDSNTGYSVTVKSDAATFTGTSTINDEALEWSDTLAGTYAGYDTAPADVVTGGTSPGTTHNLYHKLSIPVGTDAGAYSLGITLGVTTA